MRDPSRALARALRLSAAAAGVDAAIAVEAVSPYAAGLFTGTRHAVVLVGRGPSFHAWLDTLAEADLPSGDQLVADFLLVARSADRAAAEVLTLLTG